jgi:hypothetical protein
MVEENLPVILYEKHRISWNEDENTYYFHRSEVPEFKPHNYLLFKNMFTGNFTTFELRVDEELGWIYFAIGESGIKKPCKMLILK